MPTQEPTSEFRSQAFRFWRSLVTADESACRDALQVLQDIQGSSPTSGAYSDFTTSDSTFGTFVNVVLPEKSPKNAQDAWTSTKPTSLFRVDPSLHCLSYEGDANYTGEGGAFVACALLGGDSVSPDACATGTHRTACRPKLLLPGPAFVVKVRPSNPTVRTKVLAGAHLLENDLPSEILVDEASPQIALLLSLQALPLVWKLVLELYPGRDALRSIHDRLSSPLTEIQEGDETKVEAASVSQTGGLMIDTTQNIPGWKEDLDVSVGSRASARIEHPIIHTSGQVQSRFTSEGTFVPFATHPSRFGDDASIALSSIRSASQPDWRPPFNKLSKTVKRNEEEVSARFNHLDLQLDSDFQFMDREIRDVRSIATGAERQARQAADRGGMSADDFTSKFVEAANHFGVSLQGAGLPTPRARATTPPPTFNWSLLPPEVQADILNSVLQNLDVGQLANTVSHHLHLETIRESVSDQGRRLVTIEREFNREQGAIPRLQAPVDDLVARRNALAVERAGYIFNGPEDCEAFIAAVGPNAKLCTKCLDLYGVLTLSQDPYVTYESGIKVHADATKANFDGVAESRIKLSFSVPYPEMIVRVVESASTAAHGGAKWAPMFTTPDIFEDNFREGAHRRVMKGIDRVYELVSKAVDQTFPVSQRLNDSPALRKVHSILAEQNRLAHRQTVGFIECLMPFYRTLRGGSMTKEEAWDRVFVFVLEFLTSAQEQRGLAATDVSNEAQMMWACFKATDHIEEFRKAKFIEHPKALSILALTTLEHEAKAMEALEDRAKKLIEAANNSKISRLETRMQTAENKIKNIIAKNPDLK